jgi:hypothetical protein
LTDLFSNRMCKFVIVFWVSFCLFGCQTTAAHAESAGAFVDHSPHVLGHCSTDYCGGRLDCGGTKINALLHCSTGNKRDLLPFF